MRTLFISLAILILIFAGCTPRTTTYELTVMTFNVRFDNPNDGINAWPNRIPLVEKYMNENLPDIVGMQENLHHQNEDLLRIMPGYAYVGTGRDDGEKGGEFSPIFFRTDVFELLDHSQFWLSETPDIPGSIGWAAVLPRVVVWAQLKHRESGKELFVFNTHFSHVSDEARRRSMQFLSDQIEAIAGENRVIVTGDFNITKGSELYYEMLERFAMQNNLQNAELLATETFNSDAGTFNAFRHNIEPRVIDFIFVDDHFTVETYSIDLVKDGDIFISDHWPVKVQLIME
ncbi:MAG: endonuclease/exonuclease/phosphatase family protein [Bacteroidetes bacterium]|nr:MAG: endonuclease/exonuclease/phosphatase family protein [Bacteroidota bacterium]